MRKTKSAWKPIDADAKTRDVFLLARWNDCQWEYAVVWWTGIDRTPGAATAASKSPTADSNITVTLTRL